MPFSRFLSIYVELKARKLLLVVILTIFNGSAILSHKSSEIPKPGMPEIEFCSLGTPVTRTHNDVIYFNSGGKPFSLTLKCTASYPINWDADESTLKKFNITSRLNTRTFISRSPKTQQQFNFTTIIKVMVDPVSIKHSDEFAYTCKSFHNSCMQNAVYIHSQFRDSPHITAVNTIVMSHLKKQHKHCRWDNAILKNDTILEKKDIDICNDFFSIEKINEGSSENSSGIVRCKAHKDYLAQGIRFGYRVRGNFSTHPLNDFSGTEIDSGEYYEAQATIPFHVNNRPVQKVYCSAPLWNSYENCKLSIILITQPENTNTTEETVIQNQYFDFTSQTESSAKTGLNLAISTIIYKYNYDSPSDYNRLQNGSISIIEGEGVDTKNANSTNGFKDTKSTTENFTHDNKTIGLPEFKNNKFGDDKILIIVLGSIAFTVLVSLATFILCTLVKRKRETSKGKQYLPELHVLMTPQNSLTNLSSRKNYGCHEILKDSLTIDENAVLGRGTFGIVLKAVLRTKYLAIDVAVKTSKNNSEFALYSLKKELKVASKIKTHANIVQLIGAVTPGGDNETGNLYIVLEFCGNGNLRDYLRKYKSSFQNISLDILGNTKEPSIPGGFQMSTIDLLSWSLDIARGMSFLSQHNIVHGDLASRNVLLSCNRVAKLSDFGLAKQLEEYYYIYKNQVPMPWKWMAYESLQYQKFSHKTDVWSFGITIWEIFSLGNCPWVGCQWGEEFLETLAAGVRPKKPENTSDEIYHLMKQCWRIETVLRPKFEDCAAQLENILKKFTNKEKLANSSFEANNSAIDFEQLGDSDGYLLPKRLQLI